MSLAPEVSAWLDGAPAEPTLASIDAEFLRAVPRDERRLAARIPVATRLDLPPGGWEPAPRTAALPAIVLEGVVVRSVELGTRASSQLLGPGDLFHPWREETGSLPIECRWACSARGASVAVLDERFDLVARRWPGVRGVVAERLEQQLEATVLHRAIVSQPRAESRILGLLWQLADRWGTVSLEGVSVRVDLTHELLGRLVGAQRPTVSLALGALERAGLFKRTPDGAWSLSHESRERIGREFAVPVA